jgi:hypothetical protein
MQYQQLEYRLGMMPMGGFILLPIPEMEAALGITLDLTPPSLYQLQSPAVHPPPILYNQLRSLHFSMGHILRSGVLLSWR